MANYPDFSNSLKSIYEYERSTQLSEAKISRIADIRLRIQRLSAQVERIMTINDEISESEGVKSHFDRDTGTVTVHAYGSSLSFTILPEDPNKPVELLGQTMF